MGLPYATSLVSPWTRKSISKGYINQNKQELFSNSWFEIRITKWNRRIWWDSNWRNCRNSWGRSKSSRTPSSLSNPSFNKNIHPLLPLSANPYAYLPSSLFFPFCCYSIRFYNSCVSQSNFTHRFCDWFFVFQFLLRGRRDLILSLFGFVIVL